MKKGKSLIVIAGTQNRLLDVLIDRLNNENWIINRIQQNFPESKKKAIIWIRHVVDAVTDLYVIKKKKPQVVAFHFFTARSLITSLLLPLIRKPYIVHFWGSDYYSWRNRCNRLIKISLGNAKSVTFANEQLLKEAQNYFGPKIEYSLLRFGLETIDMIDRFPKINEKKERAINIVVGTNSHVNQQHEKIIDQLEKIELNIMEKCKFIFPLNYGNTKNKQKVIKRLSSVRFNFEILNNFIIGKQLTDFRLNTDILIQLQKTDAMSGAMLETLYAGGKVITAKWLPYGDLRKKGIDWIEIDDICELPSTISVALKKEIKKVKNKKIVGEISRWGNLIRHWDECYRS